MRILSEEKELINPLPLPQLLMEIHEQFQCWTSKKTKFGMEDIVDKNWVGSMPGPWAAVLGNIFCGLQFTIPEVLSIDLYNKSAARLRLPS